MPKIHPSLYEPAIPLMRRNRETCSQCEEMATYFYAPSDGGMLRDRFYCDQHVSRGCSCNEGSSDDEGRPLPCVEYDHSETGFRKLRKPSARA